VLEDDYTVAPRSHPVSHPPVDAPLCVTCRHLDLSFFDPSCPGCSEILKSRETSIGQILAIMRQWVPQTQHNIDKLIMEVLKRGAHPDDRDSLTDMSLLMYACKAGASGVGDVEAATKITTYLVERGCDLSARCRWTDMAALHYSTYFDVAPVLAILLHRTKGADVDTQCVEYESGTALHIAAANLSLGAARVLLKFGADTDTTDDLGRKPVECIPDASNFELVPDAQELIQRMTTLLSVGLEDKRTPATISRSGGSTKSISGRTVLQAMGLKVNDRVVVGSKLGTLRFCGTTEFSTGIWAGVELDNAEGKNDGTVKGMRYFQCAPGHGIFVAARAVAKAGASYRPKEPEPRSRAPQKVVHHGKVDVSHVQAKFHSAMAVIAERTEVRVGDRVWVNDTLGPERGCRGTVRFLGSVDFVDDMADWYGVELDQALGRHDGTVQGVRYFAAGKDRGVFVTLNKLTKLDAGENIVDEEANETSLCESTLSRTSPAPSATPVASTSTPSARVRRSLSLRHHESRAASAAPSMTGSLCSSRAASALSRSASVRQRGLSNERAAPDFQTSTVTVYNKFAKKVTKKFLEVGQGVMSIPNKEMALVKYIGHTDFAAGIWIGLELRNPKGKHNGIVQGRRYFTCKDGHGMMVRPKTISVHGINGQDLLRPASHYPV